MAMRSGIERIPVGRNNRRAVPAALLTFVKSADRATSLPCRNSASLVPAYATTRHTTLFAKIASTACDFKWRCA
jgi:hypothetical protein